ncbi:GNAT family N-acetyltransferase [Streptomyces sp. URMC 126]|uniref:GNAT family N-acetyltransferase n=1 Tax=Streptomyces sp. URMC 126 TaxID=3423401 RepID=UPI003F1D5E0C
MEHPAHPMHPVRPATSRDVPSSVRTLTRAFAHYPFTRHVVAADGHEERLRRLQELFLTRVGLAYGRVWVAEDARGAEGVQGAGSRDGGGGDAVAVAVWTTPERDPGPAFAEAAPLIAESAGDRAPVFEAAERALEPHRPREPAWFLATVGVDPVHQGKGLGAAVLAPGLAAADGAGHPAYLETSTERNLRFYERLGFAVTAEVRLPDDGPRTWCLRREPGRP